MKRICVFFVLINIIWFSGCSEIKFNDNGNQQNVDEIIENLIITETSDIPENNETKIQITTISEIDEIDSIKTVESVIITGKKYPIDLSEIDIHIENDEDIIELSKMTQIKKLEISMYYNYPELTPLTNLINLKELKIGDGGVGISLDISVLEEIKNLEKLTISVRILPDISSIAKLTNIKELSFIGTGLSDISPLAELNNIEYLVIASGNRSINSLVDISPLANLDKLTYLRLNNNEITDISSLSGLTNLTYLNLSNNPIEDIFLLKGLKNVENLIIGGYYPIELSNLEEIKKILPNCTITLVIFLDNGFTEIVYNNN